MTESAIEFKSPESQLSDIIMRPYFLPNDHYLSTSLPVQDCITSHVFSGLSYLAFKAITSEICNSSLGACYMAK